MSTSSMLRRGWRRFQGGDPALRLLPFALACAFGFATLANEMTERETLPFDFLVHDFFQSRHWAALDASMRLVSWIGGAQGVTLTLLVGIIGFLTWRREGPQALTLLLDGVGGFCVITLARLALYRGRPEVALDVMGSSFPSGHAFDAITIYGLLAFWLAREWPRFRHEVAAGFLLLIACIGASRIVLGLHYSADVLGGYLLGGIWLSVCVAVAEWLSERALGDAGPTLDAAP